MVYWAAQTQFGTANVQAWLPGEDSARQTYGQFRELFGDDQILFLAWRDCTLSDPRLEQLATHLRERMKIEPKLGIRDVQDSASMLSRLMDGPSEVDTQEAKRRLEGIAIGADGSCFIALKLAEGDNRQREYLFEQLRGSAEKVIDVSPAELILAGEPFQVHTIDLASRETMQYFAAPSAMAALALAWVCLRGLRLTLLVFMLAGIGQLLGLALIAFWVGQMSAVLVVLPTLIFMLTLSAAIHLINYYRDCGGQRVDRSGAAALRLGLRPCLLATLTTVFGFGSLIVSHLSPVWDFGGLAAVGLSFATAILLCVFPAAVSINLSSLGSLRPNPRQQVARAIPASEVRAHDSRVAGWLASFSGRYQTWITVLGLAALGFALVGLTRLRTSTEFEDMFPPSSPAVRSLRWLEERLGPINSLEFVLAFPAEQASEGEPDMLNRLALLADVHRALEQSPHIAKVLSAVTFLPEIPDGAGTRNTIRRAVLRRTLETRQEYLHEQHLLANANGQQLWRLSVRVRDLSGENYREIQSRLMAIVRGCIAERSRSVAALRTTEGQAFASAVSAATTPVASVSVTGMRAVIEKAHYALLSDLAGSFLMAFVLIAPVMMLIVRGIGSGLLMMIPNILPVALVFGSMGWLQIRLDVASILTASVALGIAVDDTLHFVTWFIRGRHAGQTPAQAVHYAISLCARPMLHTTIICTGSMLPFFFSDFLPTSKFALLMILILGGAILGDLLLLPALLHGPLGRMVPRLKPAQHDQPAECTAQAN